MTAAGHDCEWALSVDPTTDKLADVRRFVDQVATEAALDLERTFDLKVAVSEACANAVEHAGCESTPLEISAQLSPERLTFVITDNGLFRPPSSAREGFGSRGLGLPADGHPDGRGDLRQDAERRHQGQSFGDAHSGARATLRLAAPLRRARHTDAGGGGGAKGTTAHRIR